MSLLVSGTEFSNFLGIHFGASSTNMYSNGVNQSKIFSRILFSLEIGILLGAMVSTV